MKNPLSCNRKPRRAPPRRQLQCRPVPAPRKHIRGVALLEALISMLIFSVGVIGLMGLEARAVNFSVDAEDRNRAAVFANEISSTLWLAGSVTVSATQLSAWNVSIADPTQAGLANGAVTVTTVAGTTNSTDIKITWKSPARAATDPSSVFTTRVTLP